MPEQQVDIVGAVGNVQAAMQSAADAAAAFNTFVTLLVEAEEGITGRRELALSLIRDQRSRAVDLIHSERDAAVQAIQAERNNNNPRSADAPTLQGRNDMGFTNGIER